MKRGKKLTLNQRKKLINGSICHVETVDDYLYVKREIIKPDNKEVVTFINSETKEMIKVYNDDDRYVRIMDKEKVEEIVVTPSVVDAIKAFNYDFQDRCSEGDVLKKHIDGIMLQGCADNTITGSINKTGFPDDVVLRIIQNKMKYPEVKSIHEFSLIEARWLTCPTYMGYKFDVRFKDSVTGSCIEIEVNKEGEFL